jgi:TetR/AcrR family transcriptional regulator, lmrAB and yxaGH operons repressor
MSEDAREKMVLGAMRLLATNGLEGVSFSTVLEATKAPRGSIYHHFPEGKNQLIELALERAGQYLLVAMETPAGTGAVAVVEHFFDIWRKVLHESDFQAGCAVLAVTVATREPSLLKKARDVFREWQDRLTQQLAKSGLKPSHAKMIATVMITSVEGAVVLSRATRSSEPFETTAALLLNQTRGLVR